MAEVYEYLNKNDNEEPDRLLKGIIKKFNLDIFEAIRLYDSWKDEYMKSRFKVKENCRKPFRIKKVGGE